MISWRLSDEEIAEDEEEKYKDPEVRKNTRCTIFLGYVSNTVTSGLREIVRYLCQHKMVDAIVTTTGAIEEDFIKLTNNFHIGDFSFKGAELYKQGLYRYGNILGANEAYMDFEEFMLPLIKKLYDEQVEKGTIFTPSMLINRMGKEINNEDSIYYWCWKNDIPVFCPGITDGAVGDNLFKFNYYQKGFIIDVVADAYKINNLSIDAKKSGMILLGGGIAKHHICNANQMRQGADYAVYINTAQEFDCSDSGARPDEAVSWYKIKVDAEMVKIYSDTSIVFPIIVARTFYKHYDLATRLSEDSKEVD